MEEGRPLKARLEKEKWDGGTEHKKTCASTDPRGGDAIEKGRVKKTKRLARATSAAPSRVGADHRKSLSAISGEKNRRYLAGKEGGALARSGRKGHTFWSWGMESCNVGGKLKTAKIKKSACSLRLEKERVKTRLSDGEIIRKAD